jgi:hypothetical protein
MTRGGQRPGAGRPQGSINKRSAELAERLNEKYPDWCPIEQIAEVAQDESQPLDIRLQCAEKVASYIYSKPRASASKNGGLLPDIDRIIRSAQARVAPSASAEFIAACPDFEDWKEAAKEEEKRKLTLINPSY